MKIAITQLSTVFYFAAYYISHDFDVVKIYILTSADLHASIWIIYLTKAMTRESKLETNSSASREWWKPGRVFLLKFPFELQAEVIK